MSKKPGCLSHAVSRSLVISMVFLCLLLDNFSLYMIAPILDDVVLITGSSKQSATMLYCIKPVIALPFSLVTGKLVTLIGPRLTAGIGILCFFSFCWLNAFATSIWTWALARVIQSIGSSLTVGAGMYLIGLFTDDSNRGKFMSLAFSGNALGVFAGPFVGSTLFHTRGQFLVYSCLSTLAVLQMVLCFLLGYDGSGALGAVKIVSDKTPFRIWCSLLSSKQMLCLMLAAGSACTVLGLIEPGLPYLIKRRFKYTEEEFDSLWACGTLLYPITVPIAGYLSDCMPRHRLMQIGLIGFACMLPLWKVLSEYEWGIRLYISLIFALDAVVDAPVQPMIATVVEVLGLREGGSIAFTLGDMAQNVGYLIGPFLSNEANDDPQVLMIILSAWFVCVLVIITWGFSLRKRDSLRAVQTSDETAEGCSTTTTETAVCASV
jgi:MFS family permease